MMTQTPSHRRSFLAMVSLLGMTTSGALSAPVELNRMKAVVNGEPITQTMVDQAVQTQVQVWLMGNKGMVSRTEAEREIRRMKTPAEFEGLCREHLDRPDSLTPLPPRDSRIFCGFGELLERDARHG